MTVDQSIPTPAPETRPTDAFSVLNALADAILVIRRGGVIAFANLAAEQFFDASLAQLRRRGLAYYVPADSPILGLVEQAFAGDKAVREFANEMIKDHKAVNGKALALVKKLNVTPQDNETSQTLAKQAAEKRAELMKLSGAAFDRAYAENEVAYHSFVNGAVDTLLIPSAANEELKGLLKVGLKIFQGHQQHAEGMVAKLNKMTRGWKSTASKE